MYKTTNERIEEYLKSHLQREYNNSYGEVVEDAHYFMYREDIDDFATLIIQECIEQVLKEKYPEKYLEGGDDSDFEGWLRMKDRNCTIENAVNRIKKHFGDKSEPQNQDVIVVSEKVWKPIFQEFADEVREHNKKPKKF
jgi:hypothetical protein